MDKDSHVEVIMVYIVLLVVVLSTRYKDYLSNYSFTKSIIFKVRIVRMERTFCQASMQIEWQKAFFPES